jgi:hypothetical protein
MELAPVGFIPDKLNIVSSFSMFIGMASLKQFCENKFGNKLNYLVYSY